MSVRPFVLALLAVAALGFAACGGGEAETEASSSSDGQTTPENEEELRQAQVKFAECMRENGVDVPDPASDEGPMRIRVGPGSGIDQEDFEKAAKECEKYREDIRPELSEEELEERKQQALEFARCMRDRGIDMPDPQFSEDGGVRIGGGGDDAPRFDPDDPDFQEAEEECGQDLFEEGRP